MKGEYISIETLEIMSEIEKENKRLQERIEKAVEYIKDYDKKPIKSWNEPKNVLLEILGDKENE